MRRALPIGLLALFCAAARAEPAARDPPGAPAPPDKEPQAATVTDQPAAAAEHENPRLKLAYRRFGLANIDGTWVPLQGGQLDVYMISRRWFRLGFEAEGGAGEGSLYGGATTLWYGLAGLSAGFQYPARFTPFVEGRFAAGAIGGQMSGAIDLGGGSSIDMSGVRAATLLFVGGVDVGMELYTAGRFYLSAAIGWARPFYLGPDMAAMQADPASGLRLRFVESDTLTFKIGLGI